MQLSIIIVNYNVQYFLEQCLCSVDKAIQQIEAEVFVVDNASSDNSKAYLTPKFPWVHFKWNTSNDGFGKANNSVLKEAKGDCILFLNPDTILPEDALVKCLSFLKQQPLAGALGVHMIDGSGQFLKESKRGLPTPFSSFCKMTGLSLLFPQSPLFASYYQGHLLEKETNTTDVLAGAFLMMTKKAIGATQGFDEQFFMYGEDVDLSYRLTQAGFANYYFADTTIIHFKGESTQKLSPSYSKHFYGAMRMFVNKHYEAKKATRFFMNSAIGFGEGLAVTKRWLIAKKEPQSSKPLLTAVVATHEAFNKLLMITKNAAVPIVLAGRIALTEHDTDASIGYVGAIDLCLKKHSLQQLILCEGSLSFSEIIQLVAKHAGQVAFLFHAANSGAIVGSNHKNTRGIFIVADGAAAAHPPSFG